MPAGLSVSQVREEIERAAGPDRSAAGIGAEFGRIFHQLVGKLLADESVPRRLHETAGDWGDVLADHVYEQMLGPMLHRQRGTLAGRAGDVLALWKALRSCCKWLAKLLQQARRKGDWPQSESRPLFGIEESLSWEIREPAWTDSVVLSGVADAVLRLPDGRWCVLEFKTSMPAPEAALAQACLYHAMLASTEQKPGALSLVLFGEDVEEKLYRAEELERALPSLKALIGRLAGVTSAPGETPAARSTITDEHRRLQEKLLEALREFGCPAELAGDPVAGPAFTRFYVSPARGVKPKAIMAIADAICVRLGLREPPLIQIADGRLAIDIQRPDRQVLPFSSIRHLLPPRAPGRPAWTLVVGVDLAGKTEFADLSSTAHAHILVAGTTGSGKSEWLRTALATLLLTNTPDTLRLVLLDPKRNAFNELASSPFLQRPLVFPDETSAAGVFEDLVEEMEVRYRLLQEHGCDSLTELAARGALLPRIVCVCDEYFDLIQRGRAERQAIEHSLFRLGAKARAAGIHLILATQQASREVIRGPLDANMPARVALKTSKAVESRLLLGESGAERLLGHGDLLFHDVGSPRRLQAPYLAPEERTAIFQGGRAWSE